MAEELREMTVDDITPDLVFEVMPSQLDVARAQGIEAGIQFDLSGEQAGKWWVRISGGQASSGRGELASPTLVMAAEARDWVRIAIGELNPVAAFVKGKLRIRGDLGLAMKMQTLFRIPR